MRSRIGAAAIAFLAAIARAADSDPVSPDHRAVLDRLEAVARIEPRWRVHPADLPHGELAALDDSSWGALPPDRKWKGGSQWFRAAVEVPRGGYDLTGAALRLELSTGAEAIVYVDGARVALGDDIESILLTERARPGQRFAVAVKVRDDPGPRVPWNGPGLRWRRPAGSARSGAAARVGRAAAAHAGG